MKSYSYGIWKEKVSILYDCFTNQPPPLLPFSLLPVEMPTRSCHPYQSVIGEASDRRYPVAATARFVSMVSELLVDELVEADDDPGGGLTHWEVDLGSRAQIRSDLRWRSNSGRLTDDGNDLHKIRGPSLLRPSPLVSSPNFSAKSSSLHLHDRQVFDEIPKRSQPHWDEEARMHATRDLLKCVIDHRIAVKSRPSCVRGAVIDECNRVEQWLRVKSQLQDSLSRRAEPVLRSYEIRKQTTALDTACRSLMKAVRKVDVDDSNEAASSEEDEGVVHDVLEMQDEFNPILDGNEDTRDGELINDEPGDAIVTEFEKPSTCKNKVLATSLPALQGATIKELPLIQIASEGRVQGQLDPILAAPGRGSDMVWGQFLTERPDSSNIEKEGKFLQMQEKSSLQVCANIQLKRTCNNKSSFELQPIDHTELDTIAETGMASNVPIVDVSITVKIEKKPSHEDIKMAIETQSEGSMKRTLGYVEWVHVFNPTVSSGSQHVNVVVLLEKRSNDRVGVDQFITHDTKLIEEKNLWVFDPGGKIDNDEELAALITNEKTVGNINRSGRPMSSDLNEHLIYYIGIVHSHKRTLEDAKGMGTMPPFQLLREPSFDLEDKVDFKGEALIQSRTDFGCYSSTSDIWREVTDHFPAIRPIICTRIQQRECVYKRGD